MTPTHGREGRPPTEGSSGAGSALRPTARSRAGPRAGGALSSEAAPSHARVMVNVTRARSVAQATMRLSDEISWKPG